MHSRSDPTGKCYWYIQVGYTAVLATEVMAYETKNEKENMVIICHRNGTVR